ncbi:unnamed protein product [Ixodes hexagonus]
MTMLRRVCREGSFPPSLSVDCFSSLCLQTVLSKHVLHYQVDGKERRLQSRVQTKGECTSSKSPSAVGSSRRAYLKIKRYPRRVCRVSPYIFLFLRRITVSFIL